MHYPYRCTNRLRFTTYEFVNRQKVDVDDVARELVRLIYFILNSDDGGSVLNAISFSGEILHQLRWIRQGLKKNASERSQILLKKIDDDLVPIMKSLVDIRDRSAIPIEKIKEISDGFMEFIATSTRQF